nr:uncharacterized protein LOC121468155 isoform X2 [Taeniopygia guttata]
MLSVDHLCGQAEWADGVRQAVEIPWGALHEVVKAAEKAFLNLKPKGQVQNYLKITQSPTEPFMELFVEQLCRVVELQVKKEQVRQEVLKEIAVLYANVQCKAAILRLPMEPPLTLQDMLEVCEKKAAEEPPPVGHPPRTGPTRKTYATDAFPAPHRPNTAPPPPTPRSPQDGCYLCGEPGHWVGNCPAPADGTYTSMGF